MFDFLFRPGSKIPSPLSLAQGFFCLVCMFGDFAEKPNTTVLDGPTLYIGAAMLVALAVYLLVKVPAWWGALGNSFLSADEDRWSMVGWFVVPALMTIRLGVADNGIPLPMVVGALATIIIGAAGALRAAWGDRKSIEGACGAAFVILALMLSGPSDISLLPALKTTQAQPAREYGPPTLSASPLHKPPMKPT